MLSSKLQTMFIVLVKININSQALTGTLPNSLFPEYIHQKFIL